VVIWYISPHFGILYQGKSGNPGLEAKLLSDGWYRTKVSIINSPSFGYRAISVEPQETINKDKSLFAIITRVARWFVFKPKSQFGKIWMVFEMESVSVFLGPLFILQPIFLGFGCICVCLFVCLFGIFFPFWYVVRRKIWQH
jgi:hypothetical protein